METSAMNNLLSCCENGVKDQSLTDLSYANVHQSSTYHHQSSTSSSTATTNTMTTVTSTAASGSGSLSSCCVLVSQQLEKDSQEKSKFIHQSKVPFQGGYSQRQSVINDSGSVITRRRQAYTGSADEDLPSATKDPSTNCQSSSSSSYFQDKNLESSHKAVKAYDPSSNESSTELQHLKTGNEAKYGQQCQKPDRVYQQGDEEFFPDHAKTSFPRQDYDYYYDKSVSINNDKQFEALNAKYTQPGYTSVIVDAQQLQMANGYAHWDILKVRARI